MLLININSCGRLRFTACSNSTLKLAPLDETMGKTVFLFLFVSIACILLCGKCPCRLSMFKNLYVTDKQFEGRTDMSCVVHRRQSVLKTEAYYKCMDEIAHSLRETFYLSLSNGDIFNSVLLLRATCQANI